MIISRTPFRISLFGGGTDFPLFFREHGGAVISGTMNQYCYLSIHRLAPLFKHRYRASYSRTESVLHPREFQHPLIRETLLMFEPQEGLEIAHVADLPGRTGLGSSSSFTVGLLNALHAFHKRPTTPEELARQAIEIERERVGDAGGWQDQYAAAFGGFRRIDFHRDGTVHSRPLPLPASRLRELEDSLMLFYMGTDTSATEILQEQNRRHADNQTALLTTLQLVNQAEAILLGHSPLADLGELLHDAWMLKRSFASGISNPAIDTAYEAARQAGAIGGKLLGAGGRGFICLFVATDRQPAVRQALALQKSLPLQRRRQPNCFRERCPHALKSRSSSAMAPATTANYSTPCPTLSRRSRNTPKSTTTACGPPRPCRKPSDATPFYTGCHFAWTAPTLATKC